MAEAFIGEIRLFGFNYAPKDWASCNGQLMPIAQNQALFAIIGILFGGDGRATFALPNFQGLVAIGTGRTLAGSNFQVGATGGTTSVALSTPQLPAHTHALQAAGGRFAGTTNTPGPAMVFAPGTGCTPYLPPASTPATVPMAATALAPFGTPVAAAHNNVMPYTAVSYCICLYGIFPQKPG